MAAQPDLAPEVLVGVAINAIATSATFSGLLHDARRLATSLRHGGRDDLALALLRDCRALGDTLQRITSLSVPADADLERLAAELDSYEAADDTEGDLNG